MATPRSVPLDETGLLQGGGHGFGAHITVERLAHERAVHVLHLVLRALPVSGAICALMRQCQHLSRLARLQALDSWEHMPAQIDPRVHRATAEARNHHEKINRPGRDKPPLYQSTAHRLRPDDVIQLLLQLLLGKDHHFHTIPPDSNARPTPRCQCITVPYFPQFVNTIQIRQTKRPLTPRGLAAWFVNANQNVFVMPIPQVIFPGRPRSAYEPPYVSTGAFSVHDFATAMTSSACDR